VTPEEVLHVFGWSFFSEVIGDYVGDLVAKYGTRAIGKGLRKLGLDEWAEKLLRQVDDVADDAVDGVGGGSSGVHSIGSYKDMRLPSGDDLDAHHIVQDAWARRKGILGYNRNDAIAIRLTEPDHRAANAVQRSFRRRYGWNTTLQQELQLARETLEAAGLSPRKVEAAVRTAKRYFTSLGMQ